MRGILDRAPDCVVETPQRFRLDMRTNRRTLRFHLVVKAVSAAVTLVPDSLPGFSEFFDRHDLDAHRHRLLALKATDDLAEVDHLGDTGIFSRYLSNQFAHDSPPHTLA